MVEKGVYYGKKSGERTKRATLLDVNLLRVLALGCCPACGRHHHFLVSRWWGFGAMGG